MPNFDKGRLQRKVVSLPWTVWMSHTTIAVDEGGSTSHALGDIWAGTGVGAPDTAEIATSAINGVVMVAADEVDTVIKIPRDLNWAHPVNFRVVYSSASSTAADTYTWILLYDAIAEGAAVATATTALDTAIPADTQASGTADAFNVTANGVLNANTFTRDQVRASTPTWISLNLELDATDASEAIRFLELELDYVPKRFQGLPLTFNPGLTDA